MAKINCKQCGCPNEVKEELTIMICEACGSEQTIAKIDNDKKAALFNKANNARMQCDFTRAIALYENILVEYPDDAEAHWGLCLSRYGIEYVDDKKTGIKIPTCHRATYNSIFNDVDYKAAIEKTDVVAKRIYQKEAEEIDRIQKNIIAISQKEEPYDIFICYKETDQNGKRTRDSVIAQELYDTLTEKNYKVFFARVTLESKLGSQYEPIIFSALNSAKIMLVIGTNTDYFNAVWVKNEWSRFISLMSEKERKYIIPCYKNMDAYDLPEDLLAFQAQDMDKLGFVQDLTRGIDKIFNRKTIIEKVDKSEVSSGGVNTNALLKRAEVLLKANDFQGARDKAEQVLEVDAESADAYRILLLCDFKTDTFDSSLPYEYWDNINFKQMLELLNKNSNDETISKFNYVIREYYLNKYIGKDYVITKSFFRDVKMLETYKNNDDELSEIYSHLKQKEDEIDSKLKSINKRFTFYLYSDIKYEHNLPGGAKQIASAYEKVDIDISNYIFTYSTTIMDIFKEKILSTENDLYSKTKLYSLYELDEIIDELVNTFNDCVGETDFNEAKSYRDTIVFIFETLCNTKAAIDFEKNLLRTSDTFNFTHVDYRKLQENYSENNIKYQENRNSGISYKFIIFIVVIIFIIIISLV